MIESKELKEFYNKRSKTVEGNADNHVQLERYVVQKVLDQYISKHSKVIEVGSGLRSFTPYLLKKNVNVTSVDLFQSNLDLMKVQCEKDVVKVKEVLANILDLSTFKDNTFDVVIVNGPISHLFNKDDIEQAINEATRICKSSGTILFYYLSDMALFYRYGVIKGNIANCKKKMDDKYNFYNQKEDIYSTFSVEKFHKFIPKDKLKHLEDIATDGLFEILKENTNSLNKKDLEFIKEYQYAHCRDNSTIGCSSHIFSVYRKTI